MIFSMRFPIASKPFSYEAPTSEKWTAVENQEIYIVTLKSTINKTLNQSSTIKKNMQVSDPRVQTKSRSDPEEPNFQNKCTHGTILMQWTI